MKQLGRLEAAVMARIWEWDRPVSVREIVDHLQQDRSIAYTTVMTVLDNLHGKGFVTRRKEGRAYVYLPAVTREAHTAGLMEQVLGSAADRGGALLHFVGQMSEEELHELRAAIDRLGDDR